MFVGRKNALQSLEDKYDENKGHLIVVYGKRRLGKTAFLKEFSKDKEHFFYMCRETIDSEQIKLFSEEILEDHPIRSFISSFDDWEKAFMFLVNEGKEKRILIVIDEFPYLAQSNKSVLSTLQSVWDNHGDNTKLMCILTGSSLSYIEDEMLSEKSPLFGRTTGAIKIDALSFNESQGILEHFNTEEQIAYYSFLGGVPRYLKAMDPQKSISENIDHQFLNKFSFLYQEIDFLIREELREPSTYYAILGAVANGANKIRDIADSTQLDKTKINVYIKNLIQLNILYKKVPLLLPEEKINQHRSLYLFKEPYFKFYFRFIVPNLSLLENDTTHEVLNKRVLPYIDSYIEEDFQQIAIEYLKELNGSNKLPHVYQQIGDTWNDKVKIPILGFTNDDYVLVGKAFYKRLPTMRDIDIIKQDLAIYTKDSHKKTDYYFFINTKLSDELDTISKLDEHIHFITIN